MADRPPSNFEAWRDHLSNELRSSQGRNGSGSGRLEQSQENPSNPGNNGNPSTHIGFRGRSSSLNRDSQFLAMNSSPRVLLSPNRYSFGAGPDAAAAAADRIFQRDGLYENFRQRQEGLPETQTGGFPVGWGSVSRPSEPSYESSGTEENRGFRRHTTDYRTLESSITPTTFVGRRRLDRNDRGEARRRPVLSQSSNTLWRNSIEDSVEELRAAQRRRFENIQTRVQNQETSPSNPASSSTTTGATQTPSSRTGRELFTEHLLRAARHRRRLQELNQTSVEQSSTAETYVNRTPSRGSPSSRVESTGVELNSRYLGEFTLGLVKKGDPTVTLDQAILDAEREVREMFPGARAVAVTSERIGSFGSSTELTEGILRAGLSDGNANVPDSERSELIRQIAGDRAEARNRLRSALLNRNNTSQHRDPVSETESPDTPNQNENDNSDASPTTTNQLREPPMPGTLDAEDQTVDILARALELNANIDRLQAAMDLCQENREYLHGVNRMLAETQSILDRHKLPETSPSATVTSEASNPIESSDNNAPSLPVEVETRDFCLSIWETEPPGGSSNPGGLPVLQAYVTELPSLGTRNTTVQEDQAEGAGDSTAVPVPEDEGELTIDDSSSTDSDEEFNAWDAHSTMRNFTESTFNVDSDWDERFGEEGEIFPVPAREGTSRTMRSDRTERRDLSPATREFHRSIGIRDSDDDDDGTFNGYIMMPAPLTAPDNQLGDATPKPLFHGQKIDENTTGSEEESEDTSSSGEDQVEDEALDSQDILLEGVSENNDENLDGEQSNDRTPEEINLNLNSVSEAVFEIKGQNVYNGDKRIKVDEIDDSSAATTEDSETEAAIMCLPGRDLENSSTTEDINNIKKHAAHDNSGECNGETDKNEIASENVKSVSVKEDGSLLLVLTATNEINTKSIEECAAAAGDFVVANDKNINIDTNSLPQNAEVAETPGIPLAKKESGFKLFYNKLTARITNIKKKGKSGDGDHKSLAKNMEGSSGSGLKLKRNSQ